MGYTSFFFFDRYSYTNNNNFISNNYFKSKIIINLFKTRSMKEIVSHHGILINLT